MAEVASVKDKAQAADPGRPLCWICNRNEANSGEHKTKRSDLLAVLGEGYLFRGQTRAYNAPDGSPVLNSTFNRMGCIPPHMLKWSFYANELLRRGGFDVYRPDALHFNQSLLQHYGWRSFFVDLSASPAVAAWFAGHKFGSKRGWQFCENAFEEPVMLGVQEARYDDHAGQGHIYVLNKELLKQNRHNLVSLVNDLTTDCLTRFQAQHAWLASRAKGKLGIVHWLSGSSRAGLR
jgi:hypothetical protein